MVVGQAVAGGAMGGGVTDVAGAGRAVAAAVDEISQFIDSFNVPFYTKTVEYKQGRKKITETTKVGKLDVLFGSIMFAAIVAFFLTKDLEAFESRIRPLFMLSKRLGEKEDENGEKYTAEDFMSIFAGAAGYAYRELF